MCCNRNNFVNNGCYRNCRNTCWNSWWYQNCGCQSTGNIGSAGCGCGNTGNAGNHGGCGCGNTGNGGSCGCGNSGNAGNNGGCGWRKQWERWKQRLAEIPETLGTAAALAVADAGWRCTATASGGPSGARPEDTGAGRNNRNKKAGGRLCFPLPFTYRAGAWPENGRRERGGVI